MQLSLTTGLVVACVLAGLSPGALSAQTGTADAGATAPAVPATAPDAAAPAALPEGVTPEMMAEGEALFLRNCRRCHGMRGKAGVPLSGNENIADPYFIAAMIINGRGYMPAMGDVLDDGQIAAIATFARNSWGNAYGPVTPQDVNDMR